MSEARRHPNVINRDEAPVMPMEKGKHRVKMQQLGRGAGASTLGGNVSEVAPHSVSFPFHYHCAAEEALFIISGSGVARIGDQRVPVRAGDWISYPPGPDHAHQMINDTDEPLVYLAISALPVKVDVVGYPDSKKVAATAGTFEKAIHRFIARQGESLDYWLDEPDVG
jgi:uncharacterized cupin superfamily protein